MGFISHKDLQIKKLRRKEMTVKDFDLIINYIADEGEKINRKYLLDKEVGSIDYLAVFCKDEEEREELLNIINKIGKVVQETPTGPNYKLSSPIKTKSGEVNLVKIRNNDPKKSHRGAPYFRVNDYASFKKKYLGKENFDLIERPGFEMIEIWDPAADVLVYYPSIPLTVQLGIN